LDDPGRGPRRRTGALAAVPGPFEAARAAIGDRRRRGRAGGLSAPGRLPLRLAIVWHSIGTGLRGQGSLLEPDDPDNSSALALSVEEPVELLADRVRHETRLLCARPAPERGLSPHLAGSVLSRDQKTVMLEGPASRFPTTWVDFGQSSWLHQGAARFLDWAPDELDLPILGGVRHYTKAGHPRVVEAVAAARPDLVQVVIRDAIRCDVSRTLISAAPDS
jgi:hypothetical protein